MNDDKSSMAGDLTPGTQNRDLDHYSLLSWVNLELRRHTHTHTHRHISTHTYAYVCFDGGESGKSDGNVRRGKIFPSLIIIITVSSPFSSGQMGIGSDIFLPLLHHFFPLSHFTLILHHLPSYPTTK